MKMYLRISLTLFLVFFFTRVHAFRPIWQEDFDGKLTPIGESIVQNPMVNLLDGEGIQGTKAIKVTYQGNSKGSQGIISYSRLSTPAITYTLSFGVKFCDGFDFAKGGKLHGLAPLKPVVGGKTVTPQGWSARLMFRPNGGLKTYVYHQNMRGKYGDMKIAKNFNFMPGRYYKIKMRVVLNNPASEANGKIEVNVDGVRVIDHEGLKFRAEEGKSGMIQKLLFHTFHGGHSSEWAPRTSDGLYKKDCAYFDDLLVGE